MKPAPNKSPVYIPLLSFASVSFILGILIAYYFKINFIILYSSAACILIFIILTKGKAINDIFIILAFFFIGLTHQTNFNTLNPDDIYYLSKLKLNKVSIEGEVASQIQESPSDKSFLFYPEKIKIGNFSNKVSGKVYVRFNKRLDLNFGDYLTINGKLSELKGNNYFNKGLMRQGIKSVLSVRWQDRIRKEQPGSFSIRRAAFYIKERLKQRFDKVNSPAREFLIAFILGDRSGLPKEIYSLFKYTGTVHIIAISGLNIGIIIFILLVFLKVLRIKQTVRFVITILFLLFYSFMTGLMPSVVRAVIMGIIFLSSFIVKREYHIYNSLALAAMIILGIWPWQIFDIGFQLSFICVLGIVFISPKILSILPKIKNRFLYYFQNSFVVSFSAWLVATPMVAYYFGMVSLVSVIANLFIVFFCPFIIAGGFLYLFLSFFMPILAKWLALSLEFIFNLLIFLELCFKNVPYAYFYVDKFSAWILIVYYAFIITSLNKQTIAAISKRFQKSLSNRFFLSYLYVILLLRLVD